jgi:hypothetical protein
VGRLVAIPDFHTGNQRHPVFEVRPGTNGKDLFQVEKSTADLLQSSRIK